MRCTAGPCLLGLFALAGAYQLHAEDAQEMYSVSLSSYTTPTGYTTFKNATTITSAPAVTSTSTTGYNTTTARNSTHSYRHTHSATGCYTPHEGVTYIYETVTMTNTTTIPHGQTFSTPGADVYLPPPTCTPMPPSYSPPSPPGVYPSQSMSQSPAAAASSYGGYSTIRTTVKTTEAVTAPAGNSLVFPDSPPTPHSNSPQVTPTPTPTPTPNPPAQNPPAQNPPAQNLQPTQKVDLGKVIQSGYNGGANPNAVQVSIASGNVVIGGSTFAQSPTAAVVSGQTFTILPSSAGVIVPGGMTVTGSSPFAVETLDGVTFELGETEAVISGTTYALATPTEVPVGSETFSIGTFGVAVANATAAPPSETGVAVSSDAAPALSLQSWWLFAAPVLYTLW